MNRSAPTGILSSSLAGPLMMLTGAIAIGFAPIGARLSDFGPQATAFWRFALALPILLALLHGLGDRLRPPSLFSILAGFFFGLDIALWHASLTHTSVANATFLVNLGNVSVGLLAWILLKEKPGRWWPLAVAIALSGAFLLSRGGASGSGSVTGDLLALTAAAMVSLYLLFGKLARRSETALNVLFWATLAETFVALCAVGVTGETLIPPEAGWFVTPLLLAVIAHGCGQTLIISGVGRTPAALAGVLMLVQPVTGAVVAWFMFNEQLSAAQLVGALLILSGLSLAGRR
jgi:drug/metabolite transporter (DMT)-like permease